MKTIDPIEYHNVVTKIRSFFEKKGFIEVPTQSRLSLNNPKVPGFFCISTSFRNEPNPIPGRHDLSWPA